MIQHKHSHSHSHADALSFNDPRRYALSNRCTWISVFVNIGLTIAQVLAGIFAHSQSLIADGDRRGNNGAMNMALRLMSIM